MKNHIGPLAFLVICVGMALTATGARAQVTQAGSVYQFHIKARPGMKIDYVIIVNTTPPSAGQQTPAKPIAVTTPVTGVVTSVANKIITFKINYGPQVVNGRPQGEARVLEMKVDDRGRPVGAPVPGLENLMGNLPDKPLKVGDSYALKQSIPFMGIPFSVNSRYKFLGLKTVNGQRCADFTVTVSSSGSVPTQGGSAPFKMQGDGSMLVAVADGLMTHTAVDLNVIVSPGSNSAKMKATTTIQRR